MKLFVVLALLGLCSKAYGRDFCAGTGGRAEAETIMAIFDIYLPQIITTQNCPSAAALIEDGTFWHAKCEEAFSQGYCFGSEVYEKFGPEEGTVCIDDSKKIDTYIEMAKFATNYVGTIGEHGCTSALPCFRAVSAIITNCADNNEMFFESVVDNAFALLKDFLKNNKNMENQLESLMGIAEDVLNCDFGDDADAQCLLEYAKTQADTLTIDGIHESIKAFIGSAKEEDAIIQDVRSGIDYFLTDSTKFCSSGCVSKSTSFFTHLFVGTDCSESCPSIETYCATDGVGCETNANNFLNWYPKATPCCTKHALANIMKAFNYVRTTYGDNLLILEEEAKEYLNTEANCEGAVTRYEAYVDDFTKQAQCVNNSYEKIANGCCTKCKPGACKN